MIYVYHAIIMVVNTVNIVSDQAAPRQTLLDVRAGFTAQGISLRAWCIDAGVKPQNAHKALIGDWNGPKAQALVKRILIASRATRKS